MTKLNTATRAYIAHAEASRDIIAQASAEHRSKQVDVLTTDARLLRLSSRYLLHKNAGRVQAAQAVKRMAMRLQEMK